MSRPMLEVLSGDLSGRSYLLEEDEFLIGRAPTCQLVIPKRYISREHACIRRDGPDFVVQGLSETNPVTVDERPKRKHALADGDEFEVCGIRFRFRAVGGAVPTRHAGVAMRSRSDGSGPAHGRDGGRDGRGHAKGSWDDEEPPAEERRSPAFEAVARKEPPRKADDSWADEPRKKADDARAEPRKKKDADETGPPARPHAKPHQRSSPATTGSAAGAGKVVFEVDDEEPAEKTTELRAPRASQAPDDASKKASKKASVKGSAADARGGGAGSGKHGESSNERTAELGKVQDPNDPDYDPFAAVEATKKKERANDPQRDKVLKLLMGVGLLGIVLAVGIVAKVQQPKEWVEVPHSVVIKVTVGGAVRFEEPFAQVDRPNGPTTTYTDADPSHSFIHKDPVCEVEWLVPHVRTKATLLVVGKEQGETTFTLEFPESRRRKVFRVSVEGNDSHEEARETHRLGLKTRSPTELRRAADDHLASGESFEREREVALKEGNYRLALREYSRAVDSAVILRELLSKQGTVPPADSERVRKCEEAESRARREWEEFCGRELANYRGLLRNTTANKAEKVQQLKRVMRASAHECDPGFIRLKLILEECFTNQFDGDGSERCEEKQKQ